MQGTPLATMRAATTASGLCAQFSPWNPTDETMICAPSCLALSQPAIMSSSRPLAWQLSTRYAMMVAFGAAPTKPSALLYLARQNAGHNGAVAVVAAVYGVASVFLGWKKLSPVTTLQPGPKHPPRGGMVVVDLFCLLASALFRDAGEATYTSVNDSNLDATS